MTFDTEKKCELLAERIAGVLREGIRLRPDTLHFIDSTFSNPSPRDLALILQDETNCERDSLFDLIFFPDEAVQVKLEDLLEQLNFEKNEEDQVRQYLLKRDLQTVVHFPDAGESLNIQMPLWITAQFISRLHISKKLDDRLVDSIDKNVSKTARTLIKVKLRNAGKTPTRNQSDFLSSFFEKMSTTGDGLIACLELMLDILANLPDDADIFSGLMARKRHYLESLKKAKMLEAQLKASNIETLISQGERVPYINTSDAVTKMALLDKICVCLFGKAQLLEPVDKDIKLDGQNRTEDLRRIIKWLT